MIAAPVFAGHRPVKTGGVLFEKNKSRAGVRASAPFVQTYMHVILNADLRQGMNTRRVFPERPLVAQSCRSSMSGHGQCRFCGKLSFSLVAPGSARSGTAID